MPAEDLKDKTADLVDHVEDIADTFYKLTMVHVTQRASNIASAAIVMVVVCTLGLFVLLFAGIAFSWWLGDLLESRTGGFLSGACLFITIMAIIVLLRKKVIFPFIRNLIIRRVYD